MSRQSTKVWLVTTQPGGQYSSEAAALEAIAELLRDGTPLGDIDLIEGYRRGLEAQTDIVVRELRVRPVAKQKAQDYPEGRRDDE